MDFDVLLAGKAAPKVKRAPKGKKKKKKTQGQAAKTVEGEQEA
jgi:hypothetical protein